MFSSGAPSQYTALPALQSCSLPRDCRGFVVVKHPCLRYNPCVRLDLFLKISRLVKRRTIAQEMCDSGRVLVNGAPAKPAKEVRTGDTLRLSYQSRIIDVDVLAVPASSKNSKSPPEELYRVTGEQRPSREEVSPG